MSKVMLVIDEPENCFDCCLSLMHRKICYCGITGSMLSVSDLMNKRNSYCPLKIVTNDETVCSKCDDDMK